MINDKEKNDALNRMLNSKMFSKSTTANVLLKFLVETSVKGEDISASDIGREIFGKQYQYEKSEATVRVNVYHLRKKINNYYECEGANDPIRFIIERGQYTVQFKRLSEINNKNKKIFIAVGLVVLFFVSLVVKVFMLGENEKVWNPVFSGRSPTTLFLTPMYGYNGPGPLGRTVFHRDVFINSDDEFNNAFALSLLKEKYEVSNSNYITFEDAAAIRPFTRLFVKNNRDFTVRKSSDFIMSDIKEMNLICLSPMRYETNMSILFNSLSDNIQFNKRSDDERRLELHFSSPHSLSDSTINLDSDDLHFEHAIAAKLKGVNGNYCYMFFADHGLGLTALSEYFTSKESLELFTDNFDNNSEEFIALFSVKGKNRTNISMELVLFDDNLKNK